MTNNQLVRAVSYCRVSTAAQAKEGKVSLDEQKALAEKAAGENGWELVKHYVEPGVSGKLYEERAVLQGLLADARKLPRPFDVVIIYMADRQGRKQSGYHLIRETLEEDLRIPIYNLAQPMPVDPANFHPEADDGRLISHTFAGLMAELDNRTRARRFVLAREATARKGKLLPPIPPYGYRYRYTEKGVKFAEPDEATYWVLELLPKLLLEENLTLREIATRLTDVYHAPFPSQSHHKNNKWESCTGWRRNSLALILKNPFYAGKVRYNNQRKGKKNPDPTGVIYADHDLTCPWSWQTFQAIQGKLALRSFQPSRIHTSTNPLSGIALCHYCGSHMNMSKTHPHKSKAYYYLKCGAASQNKTYCQFNNTSLDELLGMIIDEVNEALNSPIDNPQSKGSIFRKFLTEKTKPSTLYPLLTQLDQLKAELEGITGREIRVDKAYQMEVFDEEKYAQLLTDLRKERRETSAKIQELQEQLVSLELEVVGAQQVSTLSKEWNNLVTDLNKPFREWSIEESRRFRDIMTLLFPPVFVKSSYAKRTNQWTLYIAFAAKPLAPDDLSQSVIG